MKAASSTGWLVTGRAGGMGQGWRLGQGSSEGRPPSPTPPHRPVGTAPWGCSRASRALDLSPVRFAQEPFVPFLLPTPTQSRSRLQGGEQGAGKSG